MRDLDRDGVYGYCQLLSEQELETKYPYTFPLEGIWVDDLTQDYGD